MRRTRRHTRLARPDGADRPPIVRPARPRALRGAVVGVVLDSIHERPRRINDYLVVLHVAAGLALLAFCVEDIVRGGPSRSIVIPVMGGYMSSSVVFYTLLKERSPRLLTWINALSDIVYIVVAQRFAFLSLGGLGMDLTVALLVVTVAFTYGLAAEPRLSAGVGVLAVAFFTVAPLLSVSGSMPPEVATWLSALIVVASALVSVRIAAVLQTGRIARSIRTLERMEAAVEIGQLRRGRIPGAAL